MYGSQGSFYYEHVAGIRQAPGTRGWRRIVLDPSVLRPRRPIALATDSPITPVCALTGDAKLTSAAARTATPLGFAAIGWFCLNGSGGDGLLLNATVPVGATAQLFLPSSFGSTVTEAGATIFDAGKFVPGVLGVLAGAVREGAYVIELLSGSYNFSVSKSANNQAQMPPLKTEEK